MIQGPWKAAAEELEAAFTSLYVVELCTHRHEPLFGEIVDDEMVFNEVGLIVEEEWSRAPVYHVGVEIGAIAIEPEHVRGIITVVDYRSMLRQVGKDARRVRHNRAAEREMIAGAVAQFKGTITRRLRQSGAVPAKRPVWEDGYEQELIRDPRELARVLAEYFPGVVEEIIGEMSDE